jgi:Predicted NTP binding protein (contains STAS domain)
VTEQNFVFDPEQGRLRLSGELTIYQAAAAKAALRQALEAATTLEVDLAAVTELDSAGLQLLLWLKAEGVRLGRTVSLVNHSEPVLAVLTLLNVDRALGDPVVLSSRTE